METKIKPTKTPRRKRVYNSGNFFSSLATIEGNEVVIRFPKKVVQYLELETGKKVFWSPINGVIQLSANVPNVTIPLLIVESSGFISE